MIDIEEAHRRLEARWDAHGACRSCGYHALPYEYGPLNDAIKEALENDGVLQLPCLGDGEGHRGVQVPLTEKNHD